MITLLSSIAEEESRSISENVKWSHRKKFADGKYQLAYKNFLGFCKDPNGSLAIVEEEAQIVRLIYYLFLSGYTVNAIAVMLTKANIPTPARKQIWQSSTVEGILTNEKHYGAALLQKEYSVDYRTKKKKRNCGELPMYYIANDHPGIITKEVFDEVQQRLSQRSHNMASTTLFGNQLYCAGCGGAYTPIKWHSKTYNYTVWKCANRHLHGYKCTTPHLYEDLLRYAFHEIIIKLLIEQPAVIDDCIHVLERITDIHDFINHSEILSTITNAEIDSITERHIWRNTIEKAIVYPGHVLEFHIINGQKIQHKMSRITPAANKLSRDQKAEILEKYANGIPVRVLEKEYQISRNTIKAYIQRSKFTNTGICLHCGQEYHYSSISQRKYCSPSRSTKARHSKGEKT